MTLASMMARLEALERGEAEPALAGLDHVRPEGPIALPPGWSALFLRAIDELEAIGRRYRRSIVIAEVRQKFGFLLIDATTDHGVDGLDSAVGALTAL